jgi:RNA polymerase sigma factor (sigma-70 family)
MPRSTSLKRDWVLNQEALDALLASLDPDRERAGTRYEQVRHGLITFFECRGSATPEDHADDTINRVARRLREGQSIQAEKPESYFYGVARNVLREHWEARARGPIPLEGQSGAALQSADPRQHEEQWSERQSKERRLDCLERCLEECAPKERELVRQYYQGESGVKIANRRRLAETLGIQINALRIRALRIREKLEECVTRCLGGPAHD